MRTGSRWPRRTRPYVRLALALAVLLVTSCGQEPEPEPADPNGRAAVSVDETRHAVADPTALVNPLESAAEPTVTVSRPASTRKRLDAAEHDDHRKLFGLFPPLPGWTRSEPQGRSMPGSGGVVARCEYERGAGEHIVAKLALGVLARVALRAADATSEASRDTAMAQTHQVKGYPVTLYLDTVTKQNWVLTGIIQDAPPAVLEITFVGIPPAQCLELAGHFDWSGITETVCAMSPGRPQPGPGRPF